MRIISYNIHKGFNSSNLKFVLSRIREAVIPLNADLVLLQEVQGRHDGHSKNQKDWPSVTQMEYLAESIWPHFAYGRNAIYENGHHGNAILSKHAIAYWENQDISSSSLERRGLLHAVIKFPGLPVPLHVICVHLSLFESSRQSQLEDLCVRVQGVVPEGAPLVIGGDFNDWRERASELLRDRLGMEECFLGLNGRHVKTFPSWLPLLPLDRLYVRGLECRASSGLSGTPWSDLSDHLPLLADFEIGKQVR